ncbi:MAG: hydroxymethylbilane synthase [Armatimonadota bacterium]
MDRLVVGTRGSALALAQTRTVTAALLERYPGLVIEECTIRTTGDTQPNAALSRIGGVGLFTKELEQALMDGTVDFAVHSLKDLPTILPPSLCIAAVPVREDPRDALVLPRGSAVASDPDCIPLPVGAVVGTSSPRRRFQLHSARPDLVFRDIRGNVDTRLHKIDAHDYDAGVLALAGLRRLGFADRASYILSPDVCTPAPGQGALALQCRADDARVRTLLASINHPETAAEIAAERSLLRALGGGCSVPVGALARAHCGRLSLLACVGDPSRETTVRVSVESDVESAEELGATAAEELLRRGAWSILRKIQ